MRTCYWAVLGHPIAVAYTYVWECRVCWKLHRTLGRTSIIAPECCGMAPQALGWGGF